MRTILNTCNCQMLQCDFAIDEQLPLIFILAHCTVQITKNNETKHVLLFPMPPGRAQTSILQVARSIDEASWWQKSEFASGQRLQYRSLTGRENHPLGSPSHQPSLYTTDFTCPSVDSAHRQQLHCFPRSPWLMFLKFDGLMKSDAVLYCMCSF